MAKVQKQFDQFNEKIKLGRFEGNETLREKRDIIRKKIAERLPLVFERYKEKSPKRSWRDQGSYAMGTGVKPLHGDFDIDQGLYFEIGPDVYPDPVVLKKRVHEALDGHTKKVEIRRSCVTVFYQQAGEDVYHVDIAIYSDRDHNRQGSDLLARGKEHSAPEYRVWEPSNPQGLADELNRRFSGNDGKQFRRIVRMLKRWKDKQFVSAGNGTPRGIALTSAVYHDLTPTYADRLAGTLDDLGALRILVGRLLGRFGLTYNDDTKTVERRIEIRLPVDPRGDLVARMSATQMKTFEDKLQVLKDALDAAAAEADPVAACQGLHDVFGDDFPIPTKEETAKRHIPAVASSSSSA